MTSTRAACALLATLALGALTGTALAQRARGEKRLVGVQVSAGGEHHGLVVMFGGGFAAERPVEPGKGLYHRNFRESADWIEVDNQEMGRDPAGKDKAV